ncbi:MAG: hypothetical protein EWM45_16180 [Rhodopseudomonas palustris]|nr:MAG: hypothetical protein EWM45_16180 [Rhodopseudomonas palustris]
MKAKTPKAKTPKAKTAKTKTVKAKATKPAAKGKITRREYTKEDVKELRAFSKARTPVAEIARLTNRTVGSLRQKALKLGIGLGHQR